MNALENPTRTAAALLFAIVFVPAGVLGDKAVLAPRLSVLFTTMGGDKAPATDVVVLPNASLYVVEGNPPTPFLPGGNFSATWIGLISSELRDNYTFRAELNGDAGLEINGAVVLEASGTTRSSEPSKPVRLNKGTNAFKLTYRSPTRGDAFVRLVWASSEFQMEPINSSALSHRTSLELEK